MRIRLFGQTVPASIAVLAVAEGVIAFCALYTAFFIRFETPLNKLAKLEDEFGPLWPRGMLYATIVVICLMAFGLYSGRQRAQLTGVFVRLVAALAVASCVLAALLYVAPSLHLWRGVSALSVLLTGVGVMLSRLIFTRVVDQDIFKRRVLVYGAGASAGVT